MNKSKATLSFNMACVCLCVCVSVCVRVCDIVTHKHVLGGQTTFFYLPERKNKTSKINCFTFHLACFGFEDDLLSNSDGISLSLSVEAAREKQSNVLDKIRINALYCMQSNTQTVPPCICDSCIHNWHPGDVTCTEEQRAYGELPLSLSPLPVRWEKSLLLRPNQHVLMSVQDQASQSACESLHAYSWTCGIIT